VLTFLRRSKKKSRHEKEEVSTQLSEVQNLVYERCQAQRHLSVLAEKAEKAERDSMLLLPSETPSEMSVATRSESHRELVKSSGPTLGQIDAYAAGLSGGDDRTMILRKTNLWVAQLYEQWTTLSANNTEDESSFDAAAVADLVDMENANVSQETLHQTRAIPQTDNPMENSGSQRAEITVTVENKPHKELSRSQKCDCIRAKMEKPEFWDELERIDQWLKAWIDSCLDNRKLPSTCEEFLQKSARRNELDHEYMAHYMWPLYKKYQARLSDLLSITDSEIADLCCQREKALTKSDLKRTNKIEALDLPRLLIRRTRLEHAYAWPLDSIQAFGGSLIIEGSSCEKRRIRMAEEAATAKLKGQDQRRDRSERLNRHVYVEDDSSSDSHTSTHTTAATIRGPAISMRSLGRKSLISSMEKEEPEGLSEQSQKHTNHDNEIPRASTKMGTKVHEKAQQARGKVQARGKMPTLDSPYPYFDPHYAREVRRPQAAEGADNKFFNGIDPDPFGRQKLFKYNGDLLDL
jgi:hypothetical protein